jgi:hypothetical protein
MFDFLEHCMQHFHYFIFFFPGTNPGMGFRPLPDRVEEGSLIWYEPANKTQVDVYVSALDRFLESKYHKPHKFV